MREHTARGTGPSAAEAERLRRLLVINAACGDLGENALARFWDAIDAAEGRPPASHRKVTAA